MALRMDCISIELMQRARCSVCLIRRAAKLQRGHMETSKPAYIVFTNSYLGILEKPVLSSRRDCILAELMQRSRCPMCRAELQRGRLKEGMPATPPQAPPGADGAPATFVSESKLNVLLREARPPPASQAG